jgi:hypothetical protein
MLIAKKPAKYPSAIAIIRQTTDNKQYKTNNFISVDIFNPQRTDEYSILNKYALVNTS